MRSESPQQPDFSAVHGKHLLIALSGGMDSVALTCMLHAARRAEALTLTAAHLDHGIRPESAADAAWCRALCARLDIPLHSVRLDVPAESARTGEGLETAARRLRYDWLRALRGKIGADYIALAHHMNDQAETVLMHLARGAGPEGVCGMAEFSGVLYRPLLGVRKDALREYLEALGVDWREDATNAVDDTPRNAVRLHAIPALEEPYPQIVPALARYAHTARIESDYMARETSRYLAEHLSSGPYGRHLRLSADVHPAILRRAVRAVCGGALDWERVNAAEALCEGRRGRTDLSKYLFAERGRSGIYFLPKNASAIPGRALALDGVTELAGIGCIEARPAPPVPVRDDPMRQTLRRDALEGAVMRTRRPGDRIRPLGAGEKPLSDYFIDRKVDRPLRDSIALVAAGSRVLWVCGLDISEDARLRGDGAPAVQLRCEYAFEIQPLLPGAAERHNKG